MGRMSTKDPHGLFGRTSRSLQVAGPIRGCRFRGSAPHGREERRHAIQHDAEVGAVSRQYLVIPGQEILLPFTVGRLDKRPVAEGNSAVLGEPRADQGPGEMRLRRGLLPPGGGLEVAQPPGPRLDSVLWLAIHEDVEVAVSGIGYPERSAGVALLRANVHIQWVVAEPAEANVDQPPFRRVDAQREVVE